MSVVEIQIKLSEQTLGLYEGRLLKKAYPISSAFLGCGEEKNSYRTPRGLHIVRAKIGANAPINAVFMARRETGEIYSESLKQLFPARDWILTRILWLSGLEVGKNRLGNVDTMQRYIYIHGTHEESLLGTPVSRGCIRMKNQDIIDLYDHVPIGTQVCMIE